jgi:hypothetical protein
VGPTPAGSRIVKTASLRSLPIVQRSAGVTRTQAWVDGVPGALTEIAFESAPPTSCASSWYVPPAFSEIQTSARSAPSHDTVRVDPMSQTSPPFGDRTM